MSRELDLFERALAGAGGELSEAGRVRRAAMRATLQRAVAGRRRRRQARRIAGVTLCVVLGGLALVRPWREVSEPPPAVVTAKDAPAPVVEIEIVHNDPGVMARYAVTSPARHDLYVDDAELLALLAAADRRTGLIRTGGRVVLTADVTDSWSP